MENENKEEKKKGLGDFINTYPILTTITVCTVVKAFRDIVMKAMERKG